MKKIIDNKNSQETIKNLTKNLKYLKDLGSQLERKRKKGRTLNYNLSKKEK